MFALIFLLLSTARADQRPCELGIYTYDSIAGEDGLGAKTFSEFEKQTGCKIKVLASGDAVQALGRVEIDLKRGALSGDVILGIDTLLWDRVLPLSDRRVMDSKTVSLLAQPIRAAVGEFPGFVPYDFGALSMMVDEESLAKSGQSKPKSLWDLTHPEWRRNFILEDPRTSSPGLQFLLYTKKVLGNDFASYWKQLKSQWLTMPAGWDAAYGLFLKGQAALVWSYVTSEAYHQESQDKGKGRYRAIIFREGQPIQLEGAVVLKGAAHPELAHRFLEFMSSDYVQSKIATTNWMWPARVGISVPKTFSDLPKPEKTFVLSGRDSARVLKEWSEAIHE